MISCPEADYLIGLFCELVNHLDTCLTLPPFNR